MIARLHSLALVAVLAAGMGASPSVLLRCSITGLVTDDCCCDDEPARDARLQSDETCCTGIVVDAGAIPATRLVDTTTFSGAWSDVAPSTLSSRRPLRRPALRAARARAPPATPILQLNCTYLI